MTLNNEQQETMRLAYECLYSRYKVETRKRKSKSVEVIQVYQDHLSRLQIIMKQMFPSDVDLEFTDL
jgi:hypothetical protein